MMEEPLQSIVYDDVFGVNVRFRDGMYGLTESEVAALRGYIDEVLARARAAGHVSLEDFRDFIGIVEILEKADKGEAVLLCQYAYDKVLHLE